MGIFATHIEDVRLVQSKRARLAVRIRRRPSRFDPSSLHHHQLGC